MGDTPRKYYCNSAVSCTEALRNSSDFVVSCDKYCNSYQPPIFHDCTVGTVGILVCCDEYFYVPVYLHA